MCDIFYIAHLTVRYFYIAHLGVRYEIYPLSFSFDLRCQSGICMNIIQHYRHLLSLVMLKIVILKIKQRLDIKNYVKKLQIKEIWKQVKHYVLRLRK